jgi:hypothetical protein
LSRPNALPLSCQEPAPDPAGHVWNSTPSDGEVDDPTPEVFVSKLRELVSPHLQSVSSGSMSGMASPIVSSPPKTKMPDSSQSYSYVFLSSDNSSKHVWYPALSAINKRRLKDVSEASLFSTNQVLLGYL